MLPNDGEKQLNWKRFNRVLRQKIHITAQSPHIMKTTKLLNLQMFLGSLNEKARLNIQSIQNSII